MIDSETLALGVTVIAVGAAFFLLTWLVLRFISSKRIAFSKPQAPLTISQNIPSNQDAVLLVKPGGQLLHANPTAREWFDLMPDEQPDLENIARYIDPPETFLALCASAGEARLTSKKSLIEATSYMFPLMDEIAVLVTMRKPNLGSLTSGQDQSSRDSLSIFAELSQAMSASLDLETTVATILESVDILAPSDFSEITLWDENKNMLIPYRFVAEGGDNRRIEKSGLGYSLEEGYSGYMAKQRSSLLIQDVEEYDQVSQSRNQKTFPFRSFLGVPLLVNDQLVGTLELTSQRVNAFGQQELRVVEVLSGQAAVALRNAAIHYREQRRAIELAGLAELAQISGSIRETKDLFARLIEGLAPALNVEILGLLLYDETRNVLEARSPFRGMPAQFIELYRTEILPGSDAEKIWESQKIIQSEKASTDPDLTAFNLAHLAQAAGIRSTLLIPLISSGRSLGYLQAGNKQDGTPFSSDDVRLISVLASQAAPIIENALLIQDSRRRTQRSETMRRIASLAGSTASLEEILKYSLQDLARLLQVDAAFILLLNEELGETHLHTESLYALPPEKAATLNLFSSNSPDYQLSATFSQDFVLSNSISTDEQLPQVYKHLLKDMGDFQSAAMLPLIAREHGIGEIVLLSSKEEFFSLDDIFAVSAATSLIATAIERARLFSQTDEDLQRRVDQLTLLTRIGREWNSTLDLDDLMRSIYLELKRATKADGGSVVLFKENGSTDSLDINIYSGNRNDKVLTSLEKSVVESGSPEIITNFSESEYAPSWEGAQSALVAPIIALDHTLGLYHLHAQRPNAFNESALTTAQSLSTQAAIAIGNSRRHQELVHRSSMLNHRVDSLGKLFESGQLPHSDSSLDDTLESIAAGLQKSTSFSAVLLYVFDPELNTMQVKAGSGLSPEDLAQSQQIAFQWEHVESLLSPEFRIANAYFVPSERIPEGAPQLNPLSISDPEESIIASEDIWQPNDMFLYPLYDKEERPLGIISIANPHSGIRPEESTAKDLEFFAEEAKLVLSGFRNIQTIRDQVGDIQAQVTQANQISSVAQDQLSVLLHKDLEQTISIQRLNQRARRIRVGLNIAEIANQQPDRSAVLLALGHEMLTQMGFDIALVAESSSGGPRLVHSIGSVPESANPEALLGQRNPLHHSLQNGESILISNLENNTDWQDSPLLTNLNAQGFISLPISSNGQVEAAILAVSHTSMPVFSKEDEQIFELIANQVAIALQNLDLLTETRRRLREVNLLLDFSRQLGSLDPTQILETLVSSALRAMSHAHAGIVMLWDESQEKLVPHASSGYIDDKLIRQITYSSQEALPGQVFDSGQAIRVDEVDFAKQYDLSSDKLIIYREATGGRLPVSSLLLPIQTGETTLGLIILDNFNTTSAFTENDQALVASLAQQTALTLENARLFQASTQRAGQLEALTEVATTISSTLELESLISTLLDNLAKIIPFVTGSLWLRQDSKLTLHAETGFSDSEKRIGLTVNVEDSALLAQMVASAEPIAISNVHTDERFPAKTEHLHQSWLGIPLIAKGIVIGVIALEETQPDFYTLEHIQAAKTFAGQAAGALENARLYEDSVSRARELDRRSQRLGQLNRISNELSASLDPDHLLDFTAEELFRALPCTGVSAILFEDEGVVLLKYDKPQVSGSLPIVLPNAPIFETLRQSSGGYAIEDVSKDKQLGPLAGFLQERNISSLLALPLATSTETHGVFLIHSNTPHAFSADEVELALTISNQAAVGLENARLFEKSRKLAEELEQRVAERTEDLAREHQATRTLLRISTALSSSLDLDQVLNRSLEMLNETTGATQSSILLVEAGAPNLIYRAGFGFTDSPPKGGRPSSFKAGEGMAGWVIDNKEPLVVPNLLSDARWSSGVGYEIAHRSAIAAPLIVGEEALGALLLFHEEENHFTEKQTDMVRAAANQFAVGINNGELYLLIRDQAESLGSMLRSQQVESSRSTAMLEGVADGVLVTDASGEITLFNTAAENILGVPSEDIVGKSLEEFIGLFGAAAHTWMETIRSWSGEAHPDQTSAVFSEQILLEDGRVVSVRLAPVSSKDEFLGTASIFRDITHEVEVDRLKSEFVATVSHELRTPMTPIKGYIEFLLMGGAGELNEQQNQFMEVISSNIDRLSDLVNDLLDVSKIESGQDSMSFEKLDLQVIAQDVIEEIKLRSEEENKPMSFKTTFMENLPPSFGNPERIRQVFSNLIDNAYNYTPENGDIEIRIAVKDEWVQVDVCDGGLGIFPDDQERVFDRFYRGENSMVMAVAGTGLGLPIVKELIELHDGKIWVESEGIPGEGSTFSFTLPIYDPNKHDNQDEDE